MLKYRRAFPILLQMILDIKCRYCEGTKKRQELSPWRKHLENSIILQVSNLLVFLTIQKSSVPFTGTEVS
jgi:hypothetical protein